MGSVFMVVCGRHVTQNTTRKRETDIRGEYDRLCNHQQYCAALYRETLEPCHIGIVGVYFSLLKI